MKAEELRINNIIFFDKEGITGVIGHYNLGLFLANPSTRDYLPISLNEIWLERFGFDSRKNQQLTVYTIEESKFYLVQSDEGFTYEGFPITTVHQLQNLFFVLTGEELNTIKK